MKRGQIGQHPTAVGPKAFSDIPKSFQPLVLDVVWFCGGGGGVMPEAFNRG